MNNIYYTLEEPYAGGRRIIIVALFINQLISPSVVPAKDWYLPRVEISPADAQPYAINQS